MNVVHTKFYHIIISSLGNNTLKKVKKTSFGLHTLLGVAKSSVRVDGSGWDVGEGTV